MSSNKGIPVRFTVPAGLHIADHLLKLSSARARNLELIRLAENALLAQKGVSVSPAPSAAVEVESAVESNMKNEKTAAEQEPVANNALSGMDLTGIGGD